MTSRIQTTISVRHVSISIEKTFGETCSSFESRMGRIDYAGFNKMLCEGESEMAVRDHIKAIEGPLGLMIFNAIDHGILLSLAGKIARAKQYVVGNPLFALQMAEKDIRVGLYAPLQTVQNIRIAGKIPAISCRSAIGIGCFKQERTSLADSLGLRCYI